MEQEYHPELEFSPEVDQLFTALAKAQGQIASVDRDREVTVKTNTGQSYTYTYATLGQVREACRKPFAESGLAILQFPSYTPNPATVCVTTVLGHSSGQWARARLRLPVAKADAQGVGSAITYARRYTWTAIIGLASEEDDDAQAAAAIQGTTQPRQNRNTAPANQRPQQNTGRVPESSGDRAASSQPAPAAAPAGDDEVAKLRRGWHAELRQHCGDLSDDDRHAFTSALIGRTVKTEAGWTGRHYGEAKRLLGEHIKSCQGSPCQLLATTLGLAPAAAPAPSEPEPAPAPAPAPEPTPNSILEAERAAWHEEIAAHGSAFEDPADRNAFAALILGRTITSEDGWTIKHYSAARKRLAAHAAECTAELCPLVAQVIGIAPPAEDVPAAPPAEAPPAEPAPAAPDASAQRRSIWGNGGGTSSQATAAPAAATTSALICSSRSGCAKELTQGQHDVSVRAFGQPLCPACQRTQARAAA